MEFEMIIDDIIEIGTIDFSNSVNEASIGNISFKKIGPCTVSVHTKEGPVPHFHIESDDNDFKCCICIYEPRYFDHGKYKDKLSNSQLKELDAWLRLPHRKDSRLSRWELMDEIWNFKSEIEKSRYKVVDKQPNYKDTKGYKSK